MNPGVTGGHDAHNDPDDDAVLAELRALAAGHDPVPLEAIAAARSAIAWRTIDAELAELVADSSLERETAGVRGAAAPAVLSFDAPGLSVEVEILGAADGRRLLGQLVPPAPGVVHVRQRSGTSTVPADEAGRFSLTGLGTGPVSLRCEVGAQAVETDWFLV